MSASRQKYNCFSVGSLHPYHEMQKLWKILKSLKSPHTDLAITHLSLAITLFFRWWLWNMAASAKLVFTCLKKEITKVIIVPYIIQQPTICCTWFYRTWKECQYKYRYGNKQKKTIHSSIRMKMQKNDSINELLKMNTAVGRIRMNGDAPAKNTLLNNRNVCVPPLLLRLKITKSFSIPFLRFKLFLRLSDPFFNSTTETKTTAFFS